MIYKNFTFKAYCTKANTDIGNRNNNNKTQDCSKLTNFHGSRQLKSKRMRAEHVVNNCKDKCTVRIFTFTKETL